MALISCCQATSGIHPPVETASASAPHAVAQPAGTRPRLPARGWGGGIRALITRTSASQGCSTTAHLLKRTGTLVVVHEGSFKQAVLLVILMILPCCIPMNQPIQA